MPRQQADHAPLPRDRALRGLRRLAERDPGYWADDGGPDVIDLAGIAVGDHQRDIVAQRFRSRAQPPPGRPGAPPDPYLTGLAALGITPGQAGDYGFAGPGEPEIALVQGTHIHELRTGSDSRLPWPHRPPVTRKEQCS